MPVKFYGRKTELDVLNQEIELVRSSGRARLVTVQGRRQAGKSTLIEHFAEASGVPYVSMTGLKEVPESLQVARALDAVWTSKNHLAAASVFEAATPVSAWATTLSLLPFAIDNSTSIVVLDEFPWANEASPGLDGLLKGLLDSNLGSQPVLLILVGSDQAMMERLFDYDRPLFGKYTRRLVVNPFNPAETAEALGGGRQPFEVFDAELVSGGFPGLVDQIGRTESVPDFVKRSLTEPNSALVDAPQIRLIGEFSDSANAELVLRAIGADEIGVVNFSRIADVLGGGSTAQTTVTRATDLLSNTKRVLAIDLPAGEEKSRLRRYRIADSNLRFWFRFVEPHLRNIEVGRADIAVKAFEAGWSTWRGRAIEPLVRDGFLLLAKTLDTPYASIESVASWWDRPGNYEFDVVGKNEQNDSVALGSIKWREREKFDGGELAKLATGRSVVPRSESARLVAVCPAGVRGGVSPDLALGADEILSGWS